MTAPALFTRHRKLADTIARDYYLPGGDNDDLRQEALIGLWIAARNHDPNGGAFPAFARVVIRRRLQTVLKLAMRQKHAPLTNSLRVLETEDGLVAIVDEIPDPTADVHRVVVGREELKRLREAVNNLTPIERNALASVLNGDAYAGGVDKSVDNAAYRAKRKLLAAAL